MTDRSPRWREAALLLLGTMTVMAGATISPSLPAIAAQVAPAEGGALLTRLVLTTPALFTALTALVAGRALDRFGRRGLLLGAMALYALAGPAGGLASSIWALLATRAALGVAVGVIMTASVTLVADYYGGGRRDAVMGRQAAASGVGGIVFLLAGGVLADLSWRAPFGIYLLALPLLVLAWRHLPEPDAVRADDATASAPLPLRAVATLVATGFAAMVLFYLTPVQIPFLLRDLGVDTASVAGGAIAGLTATSAAASMGFARLRARIAPHRILAVAFAAMAGGYALVALASGAGAVFAGLAVFGLGLGLTIPCLNVLAGAIAPPGARGAVVGALTTAIFLGQFASPILAQPLVAASPSAPFAAAAGLLAAMAAGAALLGGRAFAAPSRA